MHMHIYKYCVRHTYFLMKQVIQISFEEKQLKQLRKESEKLGESIATIVRHAVNDFFIKQEASN